MKNGNAPLVSVVCLCYNHASTVAQAIESVLMQQTDFPFELIVHDDASTDGSAEIIRAYAEKYPDTVVSVLQTENRFSSCNLAETYIAPLLRGQYVAICEGDDYWTAPDKLQTQADLMRAAPEISLCFHAVQELSGDAVSVCRPCKADGFVPSSLIIRRGGMFCPSVSIMVRRDITDLWPEFRKAADVYDYPLQALAAAKGKVWYTDRVMAAYRFRHAGSWTARQAEGSDYAHLENETRWLGLFDEYTGGVFRTDIDYHLTHLWFTEYRKAPSEEKLKRLREYRGRLAFKDRAVFTGLTALYRLFGPRADRIYLFIKRQILK